MSPDFIQVGLFIDVMQELQLLAGVALEHELAFISHRQRVKMQFLPREELV